MTYLLSQIWLYLLITAFVSGLLGWLLRGSGKNKLSALNAQWQDKYDTLTKERTNNMSKLHKLTGVMHEKERLERKITNQQHSFGQQTQRLNKKLTSAAHEVQQQHALLMQKDEELAMSMAQFDKKISEFEDKKQRSNNNVRNKLQAIENKLEKNKQSLLIQKQQLKDYQEKNNTLKTKLTTAKEKITKTTNTLKIVEHKTKIANVASIQETRHHLHSATSNIAQKTNPANNSITSPLSQVTQPHANLSEKGELINIKDKREALAQPSKFNPSTSKTIDEITNNNKNATHTPSKKKERSSISGIKNIFANTGIAGLAKSGIEKAKDSLHQAKESLTHYPDADNVVFPIDAIQSISNEDDNRLYTMGIKTTKDLLAKTTTHKGIQLLSKSLGKEEWVIRTWVNNADLIRVNGIDGILAELLALSGADTVDKLAYSHADTIFEEISTVHQHINKRSTLPTIEDIKTLIDEARKLT